MAVLVDGVTCLVNSVSVCEEKRKKREDEREKKREDERQDQDKMKRREKKEKMIFSKKKRSFKTLKPAR